MGEIRDAVVCGGGTAGAVVATRLIEAGASVTLLEAGPDYGPADGGGWPPDLLDSSTIPVSHDWGYVSEDGRDLPFERAKVIGGCSAHNGCTASWGHRADYDGWGLPGWEAEALQPLFETVTRRMRVRGFEPDTWSPVHRAFIEAGVELGLPLEDSLLSLDVGPSVCAEPSNSPDGVRWNAAFAYLDAVRGSGRLGVVAHTLVDRVVVDRGRAVGVRGLGPDGPFEVRADLIVLAAGAYGSPAILLRSGVGAAADLEPLGIDVTADVPGVGGNLHDHPSVSLRLAPTEALARRNAAFAADGHALPDELGFACARSTLATDGVIDLHIFSLDGDDPGIFVTCVTPRSKGRLRLRSSDPRAAPLLDHALLGDPDGHDLGVLAEGVTLARRFAAAPPMAELFDGELSPGSQVDLATAIREEVVHCWHPVGTCAMGSVADERGRVAGIHGLVVADASVMPQTVRATTNLPTIVVAERISQLLTA